MENLNLSRRALTNATIAVASLLGMVSCGSHQEDRVVGEASSALCSATDLYQDPGVTPLEQRSCAGAWKYKLYQHTCTLTRPRTCRHPCFGPSGQTQTPTAQFSETGREFWFCDDCGGIPARYCWLGNGAQTNPPSAYDQARQWIA